MKLSIIIPCYNEASTIRECLNRVFSVNLGDMGKDIIIVVDFSTDGTRSILESITNDSVRMFFHKKNMGKGAAIRTGFGNIMGDIVIIQDADLEYNPEEYPKLIKPILNNKADVVYGSRFTGSEEKRVLFFWHMVGNKLLTLFSNMLANLNLTDVETCYKVFRKEVIEKIRIEEDRFGFEPEITAKVAKMGLRIYEVGISYAGRTYKEGKKIDWKDGISAFKCIIKYNLFR